jgi:hypothetical protein
VAEIMKMKTMQSLVLFVVVLVAGAAFAALHSCLSVEPLDISGKIAPRKITGDSPDDVIRHFTGTADSIE